MRNLKLLVLSLLFSSSMLTGQTYGDYVGGGHDQNITVTTSSDFQPPGWEEVAEGANTLKVYGLTGKLIDAGRFLAQASLGADRMIIDSVAKTSFETWLDQQFALPQTSILPLVSEIYDTTLQQHLVVGGDSLDFPSRPDNEHFDFAWWQVNMTNDDLLRQRIAFALSEIFVISFKSDLDKYGEGVASYYDMLAENAFGNFEELLLDVSLHPCMGVFLTHLNNPKSNPAQFVHPDQNYAREMMQLFTIGLYELNQDGTRIQDDNGNDIPTYDNDDVGEFAKIWTGLGGSATVITADTIVPPDFGMGPAKIDMREPMMMYDEHHEPGVKNLLNGFVVPAGQTGMDDVNLAINHLFNHQNVGPFFGKQLIQRLVKSNPSPAYVARVAAAFNDNGAGVRGDMKAVIKAVLLDEEAGSCATLLSAGSVAICGASAALAISAVLPRNEKSECKTIMTVIGVTALSTIAMVLYPVITRLIGFDHTLAGIFLGATIHDVAQVVGAGYMISDEAGDVATIVKLMRVTCLVPVVILIGLLFRNETGSQNCESSPPLIPAFLIGFVLLVGLNSSGVIPPDFASLMSEISRFGLVTAVAALGVKSNLGDLMSLGPRPIAVLTLQTAALAVFGLLALGLIVGPMLG